jgi:predicted ester cyclase
VKVSSFIDRALSLWSHPLPPGDAALEAFRRVYADPVLVNGTPTAVTVLVERARMLQAAFDGFQHTTHEVVEAPGRLAFAFRISGRLVGPLVTPLGVLPPTGGEVELAGMDIFVFDDDRVTAVWALTDYLTPLIDAGAAVRLPASPTPPSRSAPESRPSSSEPPSA